MKEECTREREEAAATRWTRCGASDCSGVDETRKRKIVLPVAGCKSSVISYSARRWAGTPVESGGTRMRTTVLEVLVRLFASLDGGTIGQGLVGSVVTITRFALLLS